MARPGAARNGPVIVHMSPETLAESVREWPTVQVLSLTYDQRMSDRIKARLAVDPRM